MKTAATQVVAQLRSAGFAAYFAGGCVRDQLLGLEAKDIDIATSAHPEQVQALFPRTSGLEGKSFGVVRVMMGEHAFEVATFRQDLPYEDGRRPSSVRYVTAEEDAQRRDFTVNGMFYDPLENQVIDFIGGQADLEKKVIRAIGQPETRFTEDKLRLLRAIRFAVHLDFEIEPKTWQAIQHLAGEIVRAKVSAERIRDELDKIWIGPNPARGLDLLDQSGLLKQVLPEISVMHGIEQPPQFHPEGDVFKHTRLMLSYLKNAPLDLALAVLFHDVGKPHTRKVDETGRIRFNEHETVGARMTEAIMLRLRYSNEMIAAVRQCVAFHMQFKDAPQMKLSTLKRMLARETFPTELELHRVDCLGSHGELDIFKFLQLQQKILGKEEIRPARLVTGQDLLELGMREGKKVGEILEILWEAQLENKIRTKEEGLKLAQTLRQ